MASKKKKKPAKKKSLKKPQKEIRVCSYCGKKGHNKRSHARNGKLTKRAIARGVK